MQILAQMQMIQLVIEVWLRCYRNHAILIVVILLLMDNRLPIHVKLSEQRLHLVGYLSVLMVSILAVKSLRTDPTTHLLLLGNLGTYCIYLLLLARLLLVVHI